MRARSSGSRPSSASARCSTRSLPQKSASPAIIVGTPNTPRAIASAVSRRSVSLAAGSLARARSARPSSPRASSTATSSSGDPRSAPFRQPASQSVSATASWRSPATSRSANRSALRGLNGWCFGNVSGTPSSAARRRQSLTSQARFAGISAGPRCPPCSSNAAKRTGRRTSATCRRAQRALTRGHARYE